MKKIIMKTTGLLIITTLLILTLSSVETLAVSKEDSPYFANITIDKEGLVVGDGDSIFVTCELLNSVIFPESCLAIINAGDSNNIELNLIFNTISEKYEGSYTFGSTDDNPTRACYIMKIEAGDIESYEHSDFESPTFFYCNTCKNGTHYPIVAHKSKNSTCTSQGNTEEIVCSLCGSVISKLEIIPALGHTWNNEPSIDKPATCTEVGVQSIHCARCNESQEATIIPPLGHHWNSTYTVDIPATESAEGSQSIHCAVCGAIKEGSTQTISKLSPIEIVDLPTVKISKPTAGKKRVTVKWKKVSKKNQKKIKGIEIQVATDKNFKNIVNTTYAGKKKTSKVIKGLKSKTKYYVRIRAYAADNHVSAWKSKSIKVK